MCLCTCVHRSQVMKVERKNLQQFRQDKQQRTLGRPASDGSPAQSGRTGRLNRGSGSEVATRQAGRLPSSVPGGYPWSQHEHQPNQWRLKLNKLELEGKSLSEDLGNLARQDRWERPEDVLCLEPMGG